jgi:hypothetical protein
MECVKDKKNAHMILVGKTTKKTLGGLKCTQKNVIKIGWQDGD